MWVVGVGSGKLWVVVGMGRSFFREFLILIKKVDPQGRAEVPASGWACLVITLNLNFLGVRYVGVVGSWWLVVSGRLWVSKGMGIIAFTCVFVLFPSLNLSRTSVIYDVLSETFNRHL